MIVVFAILIACFFAMNIGASGTAASMGPAYGGGAIKKRWVAVTLVGFIAFLGAVLGGGEVTKTLSNGIIPQELISTTITVLIITSATTVLFVSNKMGIPLSTSEVTVGSIIGVGLVFQELHTWKVLSIVFVWLILPITAFWVARGLDRFVQWIENNWLKRYTQHSYYHKLLVVFVIFFGCYEAFAAGMNNAANAIGPLVASGIISVEKGLLLGALFLWVGAVVLGGPVLETNGKKITKLSLSQGSVVSFTSGSLVIIASIFGIPVPLTQATTMSIIGIGANKTGTNQKEETIWQHPVVKRIMLVWVLSPLVAMITSYSLVHLFIYQSPYPFMILCISFFILIFHKSAKLGDIINVLKNKL